MLHGLTDSNGPMNISYSRRLSAPVVLDHVVRVDHVAAALRHLVGAAVDLDVVVGDQHKRVVLLDDLLVGHSHGDHRRCASPSAPGLPSSSVFTSVAEMNSRGHDERRNRFRYVLRPEHDRHNRLVRFGEHRAPFPLGRDLLVRHLCESGLQIGRQFGLPRIIPWLTSFRNGSRTHARVASAS